MNSDTYKVVIKNNTETWYDANEKVIHYNNSNGFERWYEYDANGKEIYFKNSKGFEKWYDSKGNEISKGEFNAIHSSCHGKVIEINGKKYQLTAI